MTTPPLTASDALVLYGVTGDLAYKKLFPALYALARRARRSGDRRRFVAAEQRPVARTRRQ